MIAICIPLRGKVTLPWAVALALASKYCSQEVEVFASKHYRIDRAREEVVNAALGAGASHILFWDSDILPYAYKDGKFVPFPNFIDFMLSWHYPIISALYYSKRGSLAVFQSTGDEKKPYKPIDKQFKDLANRVTFAEATALGLALVDARVFKAIEPPYFEYKYDAEKGIEISEDIYFFDKCVKAGFSVMVLGQLVGLHECSAVLKPDGSFEYESLGGNLCVF